MLLSRTKPVVACRLATAAERRRWPVLWQAATKSAADASAPTSAFTVAIFRCVTRSGGVPYMNPESGRTLAASPYVGKYRRPPLSKLPWPVVPQTRMAGSFHRPLEVPRLVLSSHRTSVRFATESTIKKARAATAIVSGARVARESGTTSGEVIPTTTYSARADTTLDRALSLDRRALSSAVTAYRSLVHGHTHPSA